MGKSILLQYNAFCIIQSFCLLDMFIELVNCFALFCSGEMSNEFTIDENQVLSEVKGQINSKLTYRVYKGRHIRKADKSAFFWKYRLGEL